MAAEDWDNDGPKTKHEKALAEDGDRLYDEQFQPGYGTGLRVDIKAFLHDTPHASRYLSRLDPVERFALLSYYCLRKTEKQLAELVGLNECRFNKFLEMVTNKFCAITNVIDYTLEDFDDLLVQHGLGWFDVRGKRAKEGIHKNFSRRVTVRTSSVFGLFMGCKSWLSVAECLGCSYVDLRKGIEDCHEQLLLQKTLECDLLASYMLACTQFSEVRDSGYAGRMGKLMGSTTREKDQTLGNIIVLPLTPQQEDLFLTPRSLGSIQHGS